MEASTVAFVGTTSLACRMCARTTEFEQPPCPDGHGSECPEWYCTRCGSATFVGWSLDGRELNRAPSKSDRSRRSRVA